MTRISRIVTILFFTISFMFLFSDNILAYIEPSVMTYTVQVIAGIIIAIGTFIGIYFKKIKKKINKKLGIDENKNKEVESDKIVIKK